MKSGLNLSAAIKAAATHEPVILSLAELASAFDNANPTAAIGARLKKWLDAFGPLSAWSITTEQIHAAAEAMINAGYKASTVNRDVSALGSLYKWARHKRYTPRGFLSPTVAIVRYPEAIRHVEVTAAELDALRLAAKLDGDRRFQVYVNLLIDTGARTGELLDRRWSDIDLDRRRILLRTSKTGKPRFLFYTEATGTLLEALKQAPDHLVFAGRHGGPTDYVKRWDKAIKAICRPDLRMNDLRHAAAASLLRSGVTIGVAAQVLGHSSLILQRRYGHLETDALQAAQEQRWGAAA
jgi:integrase